MTFDFAQIISTCFIWFILGGFVVGILVWATLTHNPAVFSWLHFHIGWLYSLLNTDFTCPSGFICTPIQ